MKRIEEKVKDIVQVRSYENLVDFTADPVRTFENYHFTDVTAELMAKWIDGISGLRDGKGLSLALAGYRGVGKSHFLATLGAIVAQPELRQRISDSHVAASAQRLMRRHYPLAYVRRGTAETLMDELKTAILPLLAEAPIAADISVSDLLKAVAARGGEMPLVLMIDTAFERGARVVRDDGPFLAEIAEIARELNVFVGVVLDDDIAGADGVNVAITRVFSIDYLDQEHLYKVVNSHVFPKNGQKQAVLHDIYEHFRSIVPGFRWSEQRFSALYPLHPAILEVAPYVRLYVHDFALLGFASAAAERILGRPATSLIALDEVFDKSEKSLRNIDELKEGFAAYDTLNSEVVGRLPVVQRLWAKLVLKGLLLLSLDGRGTTAAEIAGSMLIFDEATPEKAVADVENLIRSFAGVLSDDIRIDPDEGRGERYAFKLTSREDLNKALSEKVGAVSQEIVPAVLRRFFHERFTDSAIVSDRDEDKRDWMGCAIQWRGSLRPGRIIWHSGAAAADAPATGQFDDWEVIIELDGGGVATVPDADISRIIWKPAELRTDEIDIVNRYYVLSTDRTLREGPGDETRASLHSHSVSVEKIVNRLFLDDGKLVIEGFDYNFTDEARSAKSLSELFSVMLEPLMEARFPEHPFFTESLAMSRVGPLVADLYSGTRVRLPEVQEMARKFALPMGLVKFEDEHYLPAGDEALAGVNTAKSVLEMVDIAGDEPVALGAVHNVLRKAPFGLAREAQHLLLTALVAQRQIDFVTSRGDRINRRSLDLEIIWEDITAIAKTTGAAYSATKLARWAVVFTGDSSIRSLSDAKQRQAVLDALCSWLETWTSMRFLQRFEALPDDSLNTRIWKMAADCGRVFGPVAEYIRAAIEGSTPLEECLKRVADAFSDSEDVFERAKSQLAVVDSFIKGLASRAEILSYLSMCSYTGDEEIEETREQLYQVIDRSRNNPSDASNREMGYLWIKFQRDFAELFARRHDEFVTSRVLKQRLGEIETSDQWWQFENLSALRLFDSRWWETAETLRNQIADVSCKSSVREALKQRPFCSCGFDLSSAALVESLPERLESTISEGLANYRKLMIADRPRIAALVESSLKSSDERATAVKLSDKLGSESELESLTPEEFVILRAALCRELQPTS